MARLHRSAAEQAIYKKSANIAYSCMELYMSVIRPGIRHDVAVEQAVNLTVQMGAESQNLIHGGGTPGFGEPAPAATMFGKRATSPP